MSAPTIDDVADQVDKAILNLTSAGYTAGDLSGSWTLSDPDHLHFDGIAISALVEHIDTWLEENGAPQEIDNSEVSGKTTIGQLINLTFGKFGG